jgi:hypothetical protein
MAGVWERKARIVYDEGIFRKAGRLKLSAGRPLIPLISYRNPSVELQVIRFEDVPFGVPLQ